MMQSLFALYWLNQDMVSFVKWQYTTNTYLPMKHHCCKENTYIFYLNALTTLIINWNECPMLTLAWFVNKTGEHGKLSLNGLNYAEQKQWNKSCLIFISMFINNEISLWIYTVWNIAQLSLLVTNTVVCTLFECAPIMTYSGGQ